jgi:hypothetical protein
MLASAQDHSVDRVLVQVQQTRCGPHAHALGRVGNDLTDSLGRQMQAKQGAALGGGKALAAGAAIKQIATLVLAIFAAHGDVALIAQAVILALLVPTEAFFKFPHQLPPMHDESHPRQSYNIATLHVNYMVTLPILETVCIIVLAMPRTP